MTRRPVALYPRREEADRAAAFLTARGIGAEVTRADRWAIVLRNAGSGAAAGALFGAIFWLFDLVQPLVAGSALVVWLVPLGALVGAAAGIAVAAGRTSEARYEVRAPGPVADEAARLIAGRRRRRASP